MNRKPFGLFSLNFSLISVFKKTRVSVSPLNWIIPLPKMTERCFRPDMHAGFNILWKLENIIFRCICIHNTAKFWLGKPIHDISGYATQWKLIWVPSQPQSSGSFYLCEDIPKGPPKGYKHMVNTHTHTQPFLWYMSHNCDDIKDRYCCMNFWSRLPKKDFISIPKWWILKEGKKAHIFPSLLKSH